MKTQQLLSAAALLFISIIAACSPKAETSVVLAAEPKNEGTAKAAVEVFLGGNNVVEERIDLKLATDGKADLKWKRDKNVVESLEGTWKRSDDLLVLTEPDTSFEAFRVVAVEQTELRVLTRNGKLFRMTRMP